VGHQSIGVDQELVSYLDRRFAELKSEITGELRAEILASAAETRQHVEAKILASTAETRQHVEAEILASAAETRQHFEAKILASTAETREYVEAKILGSTAETRRHFDVVADSLMDKIQLVGDGVIGVDQKLDRFRGEVAEEFRRVDGRLLRLEARPIG
jgi:hypothetical protein